MSTKSLSSTWIVFILFVYSSSLAYAQQSFSSAVEYMDYINTEYRTISEESLDYSNAVARGRNARKIDKRRQELIRAIAESRKNIGRLRPYNGDPEFRDTASYVLKISQIVFQEDYDKILDMEEIAEQSYDLMEAYLLAKEMASEKLENANESLELTAKIFANRNNINLIESEDKLSKQLAAMSALFGYYNDVYLVFFKPYKQEAYLLNAFSEGDLIAIEQNRDALITASDEGLSKIKELSSFKNDRRLAQSTIETLNFYKSEATSLIQPMVDYYVKQEEFERVKTAYDSKKKKTKDDVNAYNSTIKALNSQVKESNEASERLNKLRGKSLDNWNDTASEFLKDNAPRKSQ